LIHCYIYEIHSLKILLFTNLQKDISKLHEKVSNYIKVDKTAYDLENNFRAIVFTFTCLVKCAIAICTE